MVLSARVKGNPSERCLGEWWKEVRPKLENSFLG
jgi:hypothetical protein